MNRFLHLQEALIQSDLQEQLGLSALLEGTFFTESPQGFKPATFQLLAQRTSPLGYLLPFLQQHYTKKIVTPIPEK
jgi:hypothetical protein